MGLYNLLISLIILFITLPVNAYILMKTSQFFKLKDQSFRTAFHVVMILAILLFSLDVLFNITHGSIPLIICVAKILFVNIILALVLVKRLYNLDWYKTFLVWIVWFIVGLIIIILIGTILGLMIYVFNIPTPQLVTF